MSLHQHSPGLLQEPPKNAPCSSLPPHTKSQRPSENKDLIILFLCFNPPWFRLQSKHPRPHNYLGRRSCLRRPHVSYCIPHTTLLPAHQPPGCSGSTLACLVSGLVVAVPSASRVLHPDIHMAKCLTSCESVLIITLSLRLARTTLYDIAFHLLPSPTQAS